MSNLKGKYLNKPIEVYFTGPEYKRSVFHKTIIQPTKPGHYDFSMVLDDSLELDTYYKLEFTKPKSSGWKVYSDFKIELEDYDLDEIDFKVNLDKNEFAFGDSVVFEISALLANYQPVKDASLSVRIRPDWAFSLMEDLYQDSIVLPKELLKTNLSITSGKLSWRVPDSIWLPMNVNYKIDFELTNANGEFHKEHFNIRYDQHQGQKNKGIQVKLDEHQIVIEQDEGFETGEPILLGLDWMGTFPPDKKTKQFIDYDLAQEPFKEINLPYRFPINGQLLNVRVKQGQVLIQKEMYDFDHGIQILGSRTLDSIHIEIKNPRKLELTYTLEKEHRILKGGKGPIDGPILQKKDASKDFYRLTINYFWAGREESSTETFTYHRKALFPSINLPNQAAPGDTIQVQVLVKDAKLRPKANIDVSAAAINRQFQDLDISNPPNIRHRNMQFNKKRIRDYEGRLRAINPNLYKPGWQLYQHLGLDNEMEYRMLYSKEAIHLEYFPLDIDSAHQQYAQIAPYVVKDHKFRSIVTASINRKPVYFIDLDLKHPYSFLSQDSLIDLEIRRYNEKIVVKAIPLKKGHKCLVSIDLDRLEEQASDLKDQMYRIKMPDTLTNLEKEVLLNYLFITIGNRPSNHLLHHKDRVFFLPSKHRKDIQLAALVEPAARLSYENPGLFTNSFRFEGGFAYDVRRNQLRMFSYRLPDNRRYRPGEKVRLGFKEQALQANRLIESSNFYDDLLAYQKTGEGEASYVIIMPEDQIQNCLFQGYIHEATGLSNWYNWQKSNRYENLPAGEVKHYIFFKDTTFVEIKLNLFTDSLVVYQVHTGLPRQQDLNFDKAKKWIEWFQSPAYQLGDQNQGPFLPDDSLTYINPIWDGRVIGKVFDSEGWPLYPAQIILGTQNGPTTIGTITDVDGNFQFENLLPGIYTFTASYIGFENQTREVVVGSSRVSSNDLLFELKEGLTLAGDMVISASRSLDKIQYAPSSISVLENGEALTDTMGGLLDPVRLNHNNPVGFPYKHEDHFLTGDYYHFMVQAPEGYREAKDLDLDEYEIDKILRDSISLALFGDPDTKAIVFLRSKPLIGEYSESFLRTNFKDNAYFKPNLRTDQNGEVNFEVVLPDNITAWEHVILGMNAKGQAFYTKARTNVVQSLISQFRGPRFLIEGDSVVLKGKSLNTTRDAIPANWRFQLKDSTLLSGTMQLGPIQTNDLIYSPSNLDSLRFSYWTNSNIGHDAEQRVIPVLPRGMERHLGEVVVLNSSEPEEFDPIFDSAGILLKVRDSYLDVLLDEVEYLKAYPHGCNEQNASRLIALLLDREIQQQLGQPFTGEQAIKKLIKKLEQGKNAKGTWGWFPNNPQLD
ncbi:MAG: alpha-2-macroglobulin family protein [Bacteroidota bacterium]